MELFWEVDPIREGNWIADLSGIKIGDQSHIKDNVVIHVDYSLPTVIGSNTVIGRDYYTEE